MRVKIDRRGTVQKSVATQNCIHSITKCYIMLHLFISFGLGQLKQNHHSQMLKFRGEHFLVGLLPTYPKGAMETKPATVSCHKGLDTLV